VPEKLELTTQQAAAFLNVSRPMGVKAQVPARESGTGASS
jgi:hypothetical protein